MHKYGENKTTRIMMATVRHVTSCSGLKKFQAPWFLLNRVYICKRGPVSVVGIALPTGWTVRGSNPGGGEIFRTCPDRPWGPPSLLYNGYRVFPGGKVRRGRDADPSNPSSAEVKNRVELYLHSP
jgi:hypothetical protein